MELAESMYEPDMPILLGHKIPHNFEANLVIHARLYETRYVHQYQT